MKKEFKLFITVFVLLVGIIFILDKTSLAQDPLAVGPDIYKLKFENDRVRVMEITFKPGDKIAMHSHPDHVTIFVTGGTLRLSYEDGSTKEISGNPGDSAWIPAEAHAAENIGSTDVSGVVIELK